MKDIDEEFDADEAMGDVVDAAQMYLTQCDATSLSIIPRRCMPYPIISVEDVELYAHKLRKECVALKAEGRDIPPDLEAMREFFARAARVIYLLRLKFDEVAGAPIPAAHRRTQPSHVTTHH